MDRAVELLLADDAIARGEPRPPQPLPNWTLLTRVPPPMLKVQAPPSVVDYRPNLRYVRWQGGEGCWGYSLLAVWDIMNDRACPFSPNLSLNLGLFVHRRRDLWEDPPGSGKGVLTSPDGRLHTIDIEAGRGLYDSLGVTTEGTEITNPTGRWTGGWTGEGLDEAPNYRLRGPILQVPPKDFTSAAFIALLASGKPIQIEVPQHVIAFVGYDVGAKTFTFVDTLGDRGHVDGFGTYPFSSIDAGSHAGSKFGRAFVIDPIPPRPVPAARIRVTTPVDGGRRIDVHLWLSIEGSSAPSRQIWPPPDSADPSRRLHYTVRLPPEVIWPPGPGRRVVLDLYHSGAHSEVGGQLEEFTAAFGSHVIECAQLANGPMVFGPRTHARLTIP